MKIVLLSIGTRGDKEPFLAIGELLNEKGHRVICERGDFLNGDRFDFFL
jgi:hypothetical protein